MLIILPSNCLDAMADNVVFAVNAADYLGKMQPTCRYKSSELPEEQHLPKYFTVIERREQLGVLSDGVFFSQGTSNFVEALDSLMTAPKTGKWVTNCKTATELACLYGIRKLISRDRDRDEQFNTWCAKHSDPQSGLVPVIFLKNYILATSEARKLLQESNGFYCGATVYFSQLRYQEGLPVENFLNGAVNEDQKRVLQELFSHYGYFYRVKHMLGNMDGLNTICLGNKSGVFGKFAFFEEEGKPFLADAKCITRMLVDAMNSDAKSTEQFPVVRVDEFSDDGSITVSQHSVVTAEVLNSICYLDPEEAAKALLIGETVIYIPDFAAIKRAVLTE